MNSIVAIKHEKALGGVHANHIPVSLLRTDPVLMHVPKIELARISIHLHRRKIPKGQALVTAKTAAEQIFLIESGLVEIRSVNGHKKNQSKGYIALEAAIGIQFFEDDVLALEDTTVVVIPKHHILDLLSKEPEVKLFLFQKHSMRFDDNRRFIFSRNEVGTVAGKKNKERRKKRGTIYQILGWIGVMVIPAALYQLLMVSHVLNMNRAAASYCSIIAMAMLMWFFKLLPEFVPPLLCLLLFILLDVAPSNIVLSGFSSGSFFLCLSIFGIGALMVNSGLIYRLILHTLLRVRPSARWYSATLFFSGLFLTPFIPASGARASLISPFLVELLSVSDPAEKDLLASTYFKSTLYGILITGTVFLTGNPTNLAILAMLDEQAQYAFQWMQWLKAAGTAGVVMIIGYFIWSWVFFKKAGNMHISRKKVAVQLKLLGPMGNSEWGALIAVACMSMGIVTTTVHRVDIPWLVLATIVCLLLFGVIGTFEIRSHIDWSLLILIGALGAWEDLVIITGIDKIVYHKLYFAGTLMASNPYQFVGLLYAAIFLTRLILPAGITTILFITALLPTTSAVGVSQWYIAFMVLLMADTFIFPHQSGEYGDLKKMLASQGFAHTINDKTIIRFNMVMAAVRLVAIYGSMLSWKYWLNII